jgi:broad specificity phosphatase PhoE
MKESTAETKSSPLGSEFLEIFLVRHGQVGDEYYPKEIGPRLSTLGQRQADRVAKRLAEESFHCIYSSDAKRAMDTAKAIRKFHSLTRYVTTKDIREIRGWHNKRRMIDFPISGRLIGERRRVKRFCRQLIANHGPGEKVLIVAHGNLIRYVIAFLAGAKTRKSIPLQTQNTSVFILRYYWSKEALFCSRAVLSLANCVKHLSPDQVS